MKKKEEKKNNCGGLPVWQDICMYSRVQNSKTTMKMWDLFFSLLAGNEQKGMIQNNHLKQVKFMI